MKFKKEFMIREIVGETILIPMGDSNNHFNGIITINELGKFIWENLESSKDEEELLHKILEEYEVEEKEAKEDLDEFLDKLRQVDII
ncbi:MAG: PqqD family protein [Terrisporobacter othiniensis]|uniref:PqqD family protein n=1 Tax=Terrisporobacter othiniensis TaxID=1577792 RepID=UPI0029047D3B|nr:PqqD family protein [Terrisporobacter othiniensis]MDU2200121.1 PqqD family protein [Terrisporobacter othiniensis]